MRLFDVYRTVDTTGVSGTGLVAQGVQFDDGACVLRWKTSVRSTTVYGSMDELRAIHEHGGGPAVTGRPDIRRVPGDGSLSEPGTHVLYRSQRNAHDRAHGDAVQDRCENCPFASVGGLDRRGSMVAPKYIQAEDREEYLRGYRQAAKEIHGEDWETCVFGWHPVLTIGGGDGP